MYIYILWKLRILNIYTYIYIFIYMGFPGGSMLKNLSTNARNVGWIPGSGRFPGEGNGNPF